MTNTEQLDDVNFWADLRKGALERVDLPEQSCVHYQLYNGVGRLALDYINADIANSNLPFIEDRINYVYYS